MNTEKEKEARELLERYLNDQSTPEEAALVEHSYNQMVFNSPINPLSYEDYSIKDLVWRNIAPSSQKQTRIWGLPRQVVAVAAIGLVIIASGILYFTTRSSNKNPDQAITGIPGSHVGGRATLTLGNGTSVALSDIPIGNTLKSEGLEIQKTDNSKLVYRVSNIAQSSKNHLNKLTVPEGSDYEIVFVDGSKANVGPRSSIAFNPEFITERAVDMQGLAKFKVEKNAGKAFKVTSQNQIIDVLGTEFNVSSYQGRPIETTLYDGSVAISLNDTGNVRKVLKPGQQATLEGKKLSIIASDIADLSDWSKGYLVFKDTPIKEVLSQLSIWYDVRVDTSKIEDTRISATLSIKLPLSAILEALNNKLDVKLILKDQTITVH